MRCNYNFVDPVNIFFFRFDNARNLPVYGPLYKALLLKDKSSIHGNSSIVSTETTLISFNYIVTKPTFLHHYNSSKTTLIVTELSSSIVESENTTTTKNLSYNTVPYCPDDVSPNLRKY